MTSITSFFKRMLFAIKVDSGPCCLWSGDLPSPLMAIFSTFMTTFQNNLVHKY